MEYKKLYTKQLLKLYRQLRARILGFDYWEDDENVLEELTEQIREVKNELDTREHVPNKVEARKIRQEKAKKKWKQM